MRDSLLSKRLRELRKVYNYTQDDVAEVLQTSRQTYSHYETGLRKPSTESLYKLAGLYEISVEDLLKLSIELDENVYFDAPRPSQESEDLSAYLEYFNDPKNQKKYHYHTNLEKEILYYFQKLSDLDKKEIIEFTKIKAKKLRD
ncbi:DNA-binding transcriptional regulator, XRE-family HTH domain [Butyrivibrio sp. Su6]|uniref:helix-turn-helix transcriptional regulator n=1 Tax=unclassified Butyrivibrio TaxID=2639466 RepID=UPI00054F91B5|nr:MULTISPECIES: helix-turn-helix transcriptional regulator [unclassified Butyrivibrio]SEG45767.1 DNA-binding transcriptional regulator, XRE-family HTH domain [Butyrivibrio sp. Su6]